MLIHSVAVSIVGYSAADLLAALSIGGHITELRPSCLPCLSVTFGIEIPKFKEIISFAHL